MDHTIALIRKSHDGDESARVQLVEENVGLVWCVVQRFYGRGVEAEDLFQIGSIGLLKAIDKFDVSFDVKFSTYAVPMISGEIKRFLRDDGLIKVSRSLKELSYKAYVTKEKMQESLGREVTLEELANELGATMEELVMALDSGNEVESLYRPIYQKDGNEISLVDKLEEKEAQEEKIVNRLLLQQLLEELEKDARQLIYLRYFANKTQTEVGKVLGISQVQVSRLEKKILKTLREKIDVSFVKK
jgi:RNA polymerase sporulation-specific sigma factor